MLQWNGQQRGMHAAAIPHPWVSPRRATSTTKEPLLLATFKCLNGPEKASSSVQQQLKIQSQHLKFSTVFILTPADQGALKAAQEQGLVFCFE